MPQWLKAFVSKTKDPSSMFINHKVEGENRYFRMKSLSFKTMVYFTKIVLVKLNVEWL